MITSKQRRIGNRLFTSSLWRWSSLIKWWWVLALILVVLVQSFMGLWKQNNNAIATLLQQTWNNNNNEPKQLAAVVVSPPSYLSSTTNTGDINITITTTPILTATQQQPSQSQHSLMNNNINNNIYNNSKSPSFEIVVTILSDKRQSKKRNTIETADWLLAPELQDVPVTICTPDEFVDREAVMTKGFRAKHFRPESDKAFGRILHHHNNKNSSSSHRTVTILPIVNGKLASEVPGYLTYLLHNWHVLPDVIIFLHAVPEIHNPNILSHLRHVMDHWTPQQIGFLNVNDQIMICRKSHGPGASTWWKYWDILGFDLHHIPKRIKIPCCAQFMVTKERIHLRTKYFYQQALKLAYETEDAVFFEHYFHIFWGEQAILSEDRELRSYARSNWTKPVRDAVLHNPYPNVPYTESMKPWYDKAVADPTSYYTRIKRNKNVCPPGNDYWFE